jgi:hypothetical protein
MEDSTRAAITSALAAARLRGIRTAVLAIHKAALDAERLRYDRAYGPVRSPQQVLKLVLEDPFFAWLRPLSDFVVQADTRLADDKPLSPPETEAFAEHLRNLLQRDEVGGTFGAEYRRTLQDVPEVVVLHGRLMALLNT